MKKLTLLSLLLCSMQSYAGDNVWKYLRALSRAVENLEKQVTELQNQINQPIIPKHKIGDLYHGGIVFWLDDTAEHGLIAAKIESSDQGTQWRNGASGNKVVNSKGDGIGSGEANTRLIIAGQTMDKQNGVFAALSASQFQVLGDGLTPCKTPIAASEVCYGGWYLPSAFELQLMYTNLHETSLVSFAPMFYWSSTEANAAKAWLINFSTGELSIESKSNTLGQVRAISRF